MMPPDTASLKWRGDALALRLPQNWRLPLARLLFVWAAILLVTANDWIAMAHQWWDISTYNHILLVPPIIAWLIWHRRGELSQCEPSIFWPGLVVLAGAMFVWLLGAVSGFDLVRQAGAVGAMQAAAVAMLGPRVVAAVLFPLLYALFLVPFGDELVPALQMVTARMVIALTLTSGIPADIDGVFIDTPAGLFEVAEACSGVKFLIAMIALGTLVANCCFEKWTRRAVFLGIALALPILANSVRAWGTIFIAQSQGIEFAAGFDHIFYGWVFFAVIITILIAGAWRWFDRDPEDSGISASTINASPLLARFSAMKARPATAMAMAIGLIAAFALWAVCADRVVARLPDRMTLADVPGWTLTADDPAVAWQPRLAGADHRIHARYRSDRTGAVVDVVFAVYAAQRDGSEAGATGEGALPPGSDWRWLQDAKATPDAWNQYLLAMGRQKRLATTTYRRGDLTTGMLTELKVAVMRGRLTMQAAPVMTLIVSAEQTPGQNEAGAVSDFRDSIAPTGEWMDHSAGLR